MGRVTVKYYKDNKIFRFMRFLNLLEPEQNILSISKIFMWIMLIILVYVMIYMPYNIEMILASIAAVAGTMMNYSYRRWVQYRKEVTGKDVEDDGNDDQHGNRHRWRSRSNNEYDVE